MNLGAEAKPRISEQEDVWADFIKECGTAQGKLLGFKNKVQNKGTSEDNNQIKSMRECLIKHFVFYYNSICTMYKDTKYSISW
jgi:hypothetical protein